VCSKPRVWADLDRTLLKGARLLIGNNIREAADENLEI
jgi:hypothetical protein